jgi:hypothetical protein
MELSDRHKATTMEGERLVLMTEALFMLLIEQSGKDLTVEWGGASRATLTFFEPQLYETISPTEVDPLALIEVAGD